MCSGVLWTCAYFSLANLTSLIVLKKEDAFLEKLCYNVFYQSMFFERQAYEKEKIRRLHHGCGDIR